jgi:hypothetical protein
MPRGTHSCPTHSSGSGHDHCRSGSGNVPAHHASHGPPSPDGEGWRPRSGFATIPSRSCFDLRNSEFKGERSSWWLKPRLSALSLPGTGRGDRAKRGGRGAFGIDRGEDGIESQIKSQIHVQVPEAKDAKAESLKVLVSRSISRCLVVPRASAAVDLDNEVMPEAGEIHNEVLDWNLPPKIESIVTQAAEMHPQLDLLGGHRFAKSSGGPVGHARPVQQISRGSIRVEYSRRRLGVGNVPAHHASHGPPSPDGEGWRPRSGFATIPSRRTFDRRNSEFKGDRTSLWLVRRLSALSLPGTGRGDRAKRGGRGAFGIDRGETCLGAFAKPRHDQCRSGSGNVPAHHASHGPPSPDGEGLRVRDALRIDPKRSGFATRQPGGR